MTQNIHFLIAVILGDLTWIFFLDKYFLNAEDYQYTQERKYLTLAGHCIMYAIIFLIMNVVSF